jgi:hypothetical protein
MRGYQSSSDPPGSGIPSAGGLGQGSSGGFSATLTPTNISVPVVSGTSPPQVGSLLTSTTGIWNNNPVSYAYQWKSAGVNATGPGATASGYTPVTADIGNTLTSSIIATNSAGSSTAATSAATGAVTGIAGGILDFSQASDSVLLGAVFA